MTARTAWGFSAIRRICLGAALLLVSGAVHADDGRRRFDGELGLGYDSNASNAEHDRDVESDRFAVVGLRADHLMRLDTRAALLLRGGLQAEAHADFHRLNNATLSALARYIRRIGDGYRAPSWAAWASAAWWEFDSRLRDSAEYRAGAYLTGPLGADFTGRLSLTASRREADSAVFDLDGVALAADLDWAATPRLTLYGGTQFRDGDVVSTATPSPAIRDAADAREPDDAFGANHVAYRLDGKTWIHTLGVNYGLTPKLSLDVQAQYVDADAAGDNEYQRWTVIASVLARF